MDFFKVVSKPAKKGLMEVYPEFRMAASKDLMVRGRAFYAVWDEDVGLWSTDEFKVVDIVDRELQKVANELAGQTNDGITVRYMSNFSSRSWIEWKNFISKSPDNSHSLDSKVTFQNSEINQKSYASKRLPYDLSIGSYDCWNKLVGTLYSEDERRKIEWAIGAIISGDSKNIQKFMVFYGDPGSGKSTILNVIQMLFEGYYSVFEAKALTSSSNVFATEAFRTNPLLAIQHDGDLSRIEDNTRLNSIVSHEEMIINEKFKSGYSMRLNCFLMMATNKPVKITDAKAGMIRRLIDIRPSGRKLSPDEYDEVMNGISYELGAIANHCLEVYKSMGKTYYNSYRPIDMMYKTDPFFNFVEDSSLIFEAEDGVTLKSAYALYKQYCEETNADYRLQMYKFREELKNYFRDFLEDAHLPDGTHVRNYYSGFDTKRFNKQVLTNEIRGSKSWLKMTRSTSLFDEEYGGSPAQYANESGTPTKKWSEVETKLIDISTTETHYVRLPENHIVIDFDLKDEDGKKSKEKNLEAASKWPPTYAEFSKSGSGIHLHYIYDGDPTKLSRVYGDNIEIKVFTGNSSLRRRLTKCNDLPVTSISSGLPLKKGDKMVNFEAVKNEKQIRALIKKNLKKEIHPGTKPSVDFIFKILEDAYASGAHYDVTDMRPSIFAFAANSTNQSDYCLKLVGKMKFASEEISSNPNENADDSLIFYDVEVFPNLFLVNWKKLGPEHSVIRMINPTPTEIETLLKHKLVGFNNRRYDNHILYARMMGYTNEQLFNLSQRIVNGSFNAMFGEAYNLSYADIYDFCSVKQSLKKWEIELGIHHQELGLPWDQPVPEEKWELVAEYCDNDVIATEAVWNARQQDLLARKILASLSGLSVNDTTRMHTTKIIFGNEKHPDLVYTDLSEMFPGYSFEGGKSSYRGEDPGEGGYVYAEPGMYGNVALLDIASMHPTSIINLNLFGSYTPRFKAIKDARLFIKHKDFDSARQLMDGALAPFLEDESQAGDLAQALKIVINSVYGYTTATFDNPFKDNRNKDNIVAKRGALFMINLKHEVQERGFTVAHIKTDSIKIPDATPEIIQFVMDYGRQYGYEFEHEATYDRMCLVNDAVYIAKYKDGKHAGEWTATGTQFQVPYVFKTLFSKESLIFADMCETKTVTSSLYLDFNEGLPDGEHRYRFIGKAGLFTPVKPGLGGGELFREKDGKYYAATGTKGYRWLESETMDQSNFDAIDISFYNELANTAVETISQYGDFEWFVSDDPYVEPPFVGAKIA